MSWEQAIQGSSHITKPDRVQETFAQWSQIHGVTPGDVCAELKAELSDPCGCLRTRQILYFSSRYREARLTG